MRGIVEPRNSLGILISSSFSMKPNITILVIILVLLKHQSEFYQLSKDNNKICFSKQICDSKIYFRKKIHIHKKLNYGYRWR